MQISGNLLRCPGTCTHRCAGILSNEIDAEPIGNVASVVFVQAIKGEAVVAQSRGLTNTSQAISASASGQAGAT